MKTVLVGVGQAGGKITTALAEFDAEMGFDSVLDALAINTAQADLSGLPMDTALIGQDKVSGHGVGGDNELGAAVMESDINEVMGTLSEKIDARTEAVVVIAGLGGGSGSGGAPVLVRQLKRVYDVPIYALGILPGKDEGTLYQVNAGRSLKTLAREADSLLLVDNDAWKQSGESVSEGYNAINQNIARRFGLLFAAGEATHGVAESVVDTSEVINTLRSGGLAALGYASSLASDDPTENLNAITSTARNALLTGSSLPGATDADSALLVIAGNPERISRKGVEKARRWLEDETGSMQVRGGDFPIESDRVAALILLGGVERSNRVERFLERARLALEEEREKKETEVDRRSVFETDELENLF